MNDPFRIRAARQDDLDSMLSLNHEAEPGVGAVSAERLADLAVGALSALVAVDAAEADRRLGFILALPLGLIGYDSPNYAWAAARGGSSAYLDRIAVTAAARGRGVGAALYAETFKALSGRAEELVCEVNLVPPNPGSLRFHQRLGFREIGRAAHAPGSYEVAFLARLI